MPRSYKTPGGRIIRRTSGGRFRQSSLEDYGIPRSALADGEMKCADCGHEWYPVLKTGHCPKCGSQEKATLNPES